MQQHKICCINIMEENIHNFMRFYKHSIFLPLFSPQTLHVLRLESFLSDCGCKCSWELWFVCYLVNMLFQSQQNLDTYGNIFDAEWGEPSTYCMFFNPKIFIFFFLLYKRIFSTKHWHPLDKVEMKKVEEKFPYIFICFQCHSEFRF